MIFSCEKALLQSAAATAGRVVAAKSSIQALEGILVEAEESGALRLSGYNLETGVVTRMEAQISQPGSVVLSARLFGEILRRMPDDIVTVSEKNGSVNISCGPTSFDVIGSSAEDFPKLPQVDEGASISLSQANLKAMIGQVIFAVSDNESRPAHTGALFEAEGDVLTMVAVDGYRLALRREKLLQGPQDESQSFIVPGKALSEVEKICDASDEPVTVTEGERHIMFEVGNTLLVSRRLEGDFLNYRNTIPKNNAIAIAADTAALQLSIDRASLIINEKLKSPLRCKFEDGTLSITSRTAIGSAFDRCPIEGNGKGLEIGFNNRFLMDAVKAAPAQKVRLELNTPTSPCLLLPMEEGNDSFLYMVLPVRLRAGE